MKRKLIKGLAEVVFMTVFAGFMVWQLVAAVDHEARVDERKRLAAERAAMKLEVVREHNQEVNTRINATIKRMQEGRP